MLTYKEENRVRRWFTEAEVSLFQNGSLGGAAAELHGFLDGEGDDDPFRRRLAALERLAELPRDRWPASEYVRRWGFGGVNLFRTRGGVRLYQIAIRSFPNHDTKCYYLPEPEPTLIDLGSGMRSNTEDWEARLPILDEIFGVFGSFERLQHLVISHGHMDHYGWLPYLLEKARPQIYCHELDARVLEQFDERIALAGRDLAAYLRHAGLSEERTSELIELFKSGRNFFRNVPVDVRLKHGATVPGGGQVIHTPGHCAGLVCIRFDDLLFTADHLLLDVTPHQAPQALNPFFGLENYFSSLRRVGAQSGIRLGLTSHGPEIHDLAGRIYEILYFHQRRLWQILELCEEPRTVADIAHELFGELDGYHVILGVEEAGAHVEYLHQHGWLRVANLEALENGEAEVLYRQDPETVKRRKEPTIHTHSPKTA